MNYDTFTINKVKLMLSAEDIKFYLKIFKGLCVHELKEIFELTHIRHVPANCIYIEEGATPNKLSLIREGLMRAYRIKSNGDEVTVLLRWENQFVASHDSILLRQPSRFTYQALEDTVLLELDYSKVIIVMENNPKLSARRNIFLLSMLSEALERMESFILLSPEERYLQLLKDKPDIMNRVQNKYLATLLGITPVSLSRIRKRITRNLKR